MYHLTRICLRAPSIAWICLFLVSAVLIAGLPRVHTEFGYRPLLGGDHPAIQRLEGFVENYGGGFPLFIVWECGDGFPCSEALDEKSVTLAAEVESMLGGIEGVQTVQGPASASVLVLNPEGFEVRRLFENGALAEDFETISAHALRDRMWSGNFVSEDGSVAAVIANLSDSKSDNMVRIINQLRTGLETFEAQGFEFHLAGHAVESVVAGEELATSMTQLVPVVAIIIALTLYFLTRSWQAVVTSLLTMGVALLWTMGLLGWIGWPQDTLLQSIATVILIVGICGAVHLLAGYSVEIDSSGDDPGPTERDEAMNRAAKDLGPACTITTLTTAGAFLSFVLSDLATFDHFGVIAAAGVTFCLLSTFTLLPLLVRLMPPRSFRPTNDQGTWDAILGAVIATADRRSVPILIASSLLLVVCAYGALSFLSVDTDPNRLYGEQSQVTRWIHYVDDRLRGLDTLEVDVGLPAGSQFESPETQASITAFTEFLRGTDGLGQVISSQDLIRRLNRALHDGDPAFDRVGDSLSANGEILELIRFDDTATLDTWVSLDRSHFRISAEGPSDSAVGREEVIQVVQSYIDAKLPSDWDVTLTGPFVIERDWVIEIQETQIRSFLGAFIAALILVSIFLRSIPLGLAVMVPAVLPVVVSLGVMGFSGIPLDVGRCMIAAIVIGIAVDDGVHLMSHYRVQRMAGATARQAIEASVHHVGRAVVVTSVSLSLGWVSFVASAWETISSFGFFVSVAILGALAATLYVLPAVIFVFQGSDEETAVDDALERA